MLFSAFPLSPLFSLVATDPTIVSLVQVSATTVRVEWSQPSGGASVTGYTVHYSDGSTDRSMSASSTSADITGLVNDGRPYSISVEATSEHLSGESASQDITLCEFTMNNTCKSYKQYFSNPSHSNCSRGCECE